MKKKYTLGLGLTLLALMAGCVGYVDGDGGAVVVPEPEIGLYGGGFFERGHDVHAYSVRGAHSRGGRGWRR